MAMTGMCDHEDASFDDGMDEREKPSSKLGLYPPRPSNSTTMTRSKWNSGERPSSDLWLSIMCALGEGEGELAYALLDEKNVMDELADTCDNFNR